MIDAHRPGTVYALTGGGLFRTTNGGARWRVIAPQRFKIPSRGSYGRYWYSVAAAIDPDHAQTVYASWDTAGGLSGFPRPLTDLYRSSDGGDSWQRIDVRGGAPWFSSLALATGSPGTILATSSWGPGVYKSSDGGATWSLAGLAGQPLGNGLEADPGRPGTVYASTGSSLFKTSDGGASWQSLGNVANIGRGGAVATDPAQSNTGLVATSISALVLAPRSSETLYAAAGGVLKSSDGGRSWKTTSGPKGASVTVLAVDPHHPQTIYAGSSDHGLFNSFDGGAHWSQMNSDARPNFETLAIDPNHPGTLYISACINRLGCGYHALFLKTTNGGASWQQIGASAIPWAVRSLAVDPTRSNVVFAGTSRGGLYRSTDVGHSWRIVAIAHGGPTSHRGAPDAISTIAIDPADPNTVYAGTTDNGILKSTDDGTPGQPPTPV